MPRKRQCDTNHQREMSNKNRKCKIARLLAFFFILWYTKNDNAFEFMRYENERKRENTAIKSSYKISLKKILRK